MRRTLLFTGLYLLHLVTLFLVIGLFEFHYINDWILEFGRQEAPKATQSASAQSLFKAYDEKKPKTVLDAALLQQLRSGGYTLFFRHTSRPQYKHFIELDRLALGKDIQAAGPFSKGICLTEEGRAEAQLIGHVFRQHAIPIGAIYSSPICRAIETAEYAFGHVDKLSKGLLWNVFYDHDEALLEAMKSRGRALMLETPKPGTNTVISAHSSVLEFLGFHSASLGEGGMAVFSHKEEGDIELVAVIQLEELAKALIISPED